MKENIRKWLLSAVIILSVYRLNAQDPITAYIDQAFENNLALKEKKSPCLKVLLL